MKDNQVKTESVVKNNQGFTLIEMLIVISLIGMVMAFVGSNIFSKFEGAKVNTTKIQMKQLKTALDDFRRVCNFYPETNSGLEALVTQPTGGKECKGYEPGGFIAGGKVPKDGWSNDFVYENNGGKVSLKSQGADGAEGGEGNDKDITLDDLN